MLRFFTKYHKWIGLFFTFFILMFALSGIFLNHRTLIAGWEMPRQWLPKNYAYTNWNNGAVSGTIPIDSNHILMYGANGVWLTDSLCRNTRFFGKGMKSGADNRNIRAAVKTSNGEIFAISAFSLYRFDAATQTWNDVSDGMHSPDYLTDVQSLGDTLFIVSRSHVYQSVVSFTEFSKIQLQQPLHYSEKGSLFRTLWLLHSGELFGIAGKIAVDIVGVVTVILCITGLIVFFFKIPIKRRKKKGTNSPNLKRSWNFSWRWHNKLGNLFFVLLLIITLTGMFLRPPLLIPIARSKVSPIPGSTLKSANAWHDKLRRLRYDDEQNRWLLSTTDGFYALASLGDVPEKIASAPPVSVMGVTVWQKAENGEWILGSFSGIYRWDIAGEKAYDYYTGKPIVSKRPSGRPTFTNAISGYSADFAQGNVVFDYNKGAITENESFPPMPTSFSNAKISFWNFCLELHVGRLYYSFMRSFTDFYIFFAGLLMLFITVSGYVVYRKRFRRRNSAGKLK